MRRLLFFLLLFLISASTFSQNWDLFVPSQKSLYSNYFGYEDIRIDSTLIQGGTSTFIFNDRIRNGKCLSDSNRNFAFYGGYFLVPKTSAVSNNQTKFFCTRGNLTSELIFKQHASIGDTWPIAQTNLYFKCRSISYGNVFGESDSLKYFDVYEIGHQNPIKEYEFILSKKIGLLQFASITRLAFADTIGLRSSSLLGFRKNSINKGFIVPDFNDFFHLHAADVLVWKYHEKNLDISIPDKIYYYKDSILKAEHTVEKVKYVFQRTKKSIVEIDSIYYTRKEFDDYLIMNPSHYIIADKNPIHHFSHFGDDYFTHILVDDISIFDSITKLNFYWSGWSHHKIDCSEGLLLDVGSFFSINTKVGVLNYGIESFGTTTNEVVGSVIDGVASGITTIPTSVSVYKNIEHLVYPNPANTTISIQGNFNKNTPYVITNLQGQVVQEGILAPLINIESLPKGLYYLQLEDKESVCYAKFLKF